MLTASRESTAEVGRCILEDERVAKISFTGSTAVGKVCDILVYVCVLNY